VPAAPAPAAPPEALRRRAVPAPAAPRDDVTRLTRPRARVQDDVDTEQLRAMVDDLRAEMETLRQLLDQIRAQAGAARSRSPRNTGAR
jgi:hypothetical protein